MTREDQIVEAVARAAYQQGLLSGPTRAKVDEDLSIGWPRGSVSFELVDDGNPHHFGSYRFKFTDEIPPDWLTALLLGGSEGAKR